MLSVHVCAYDRSLGHGQPSRGCIHDHDLLSFFQHSSIAVELHEPFPSLYWNFDWFGLIQIFCLPQKLLWGFWVHCPYCVWKILFHNITIVCLTLKNLFNPHPLGALGSGMLLPMDGTCKGALVGTYIPSPTLNKFSKEFSMLKSSVENLNF